MEPNGDTMNANPPDPCPVCGTVGCELNRPPTDEDRLSSIEDRLALHSRISLEDAMWLAAQARSLSAAKAAAAGLRAALWGGARAKEPVMATNLRAIADLIDIASQLVKRVHGSSSGINESVPATLRAYANNIDAALATGTEGAAPATLPHDSAHAGTATTGEES